ncbi:hypothetical protein BCR37DRAFT_378094 [Protomyces lactucae-debilis]|uniref:Uncharacterized protein n=1 Tax=Protomyces lactucae-debilis TaxID=2754530 RepID=A0A1Y2FM90_PROLT|nr:uncharacterized protein BCR37DRAFT_378094 [Protomyces lactucae-debilis]ORY85058.1 hypothetical protein BCR37DRAFT_378094 [Protomyces lactucae-debilis]
MSLRWRPVKSSPDWSLIKFSQMLSRWHTLSKHTDGLLLTGVICSVPSPAAPVCACYPINGPDGSFSRIQKARKSSRRCVVLDARL